jgi:hypothetical protein
MFTIDVFSNKDYYIILKEGKQFVLVSKASNSVMDVIRFFNIEN